MVFLVNDVWRLAASRSVSACTVLKPSRRSRCLMRVPENHVAYDVRSIREDFKGSLWMLVVENNTRVTLIKVLDTTPMRKVGLELSNLEHSVSAGGTFT